MDEHDIETIERHAHRWRVDFPDNPQTIGTCTICGANRLINNPLDDDGNIR